MTVWSLVDKSVSYIKYPKDCQQSIDFTQNGKYMALAERRDCKDCVSVFTCSTWQLLKVGRLGACQGVQSLVLLSQLFYLCVIEKIHKFL